MSDEQQPLFPAGKPVTPLRALTARQQQIYELICAQPEGVEAIELGGLLHEQAGRHHRERYCEWCGRDGARVLREKAIRLRLIRRAGGIYEPRNEADWVGKADVSPPPSQLSALPGDSFEDIFRGSDAA